jgi:hypothetical protein
VTVPGVRVTSVRRTVGVAVALVTGQALLCGIIGIVTFTDRGTSAPGAQAPAPQLAGPPPVVPSAGPPPADAPVDHPEPGTTRHGRIELPTSPAAPVAVRNSATRTIGPSRTASVSPAPTTSPPDVALIPPSPAAPDGDAPVPAVEGERCDDEGALGETAAGKAVRCERDRRGDLRWRVV